MKHFTDGSFKFSADPFPAFRSNLVFGRNKRAFEFLPTKIAPDDEEGLLPEGGFKVIKTQAKGTILVVPGNDNTNRALVFAGINGGFRGWCGLHQDTTATVLKQCTAGNNCDSRTEAIAILEPGQKIVFHSTGRRTNDIIVVSFDGSDITRTTYHKSEYEATGETLNEAETL